MPDKPRYPTIKPKLYRLFKFILRVILASATRRHVSGLEHVPASGPFIAVMNHLSYVDAPLLSVTMPRMLQPLAAEKYESHPFKFILDVAGTIYIDRFNPDLKALRQALMALKGGVALTVAAEGTRSKTSALTEGKSGAAFLATRADVPVLPVAMHGTEKVFGNLRHLRRTDIYIIFGKPIPLPAGRASAEELDAYTDQIMVALAAMLPEDYRGIYAKHPLLPDLLAAQ